MKKIQTNKKSNKNMDAVSIPPPPKKTIRNIKGNRDLYIQLRVNNGAEKNEKKKNKRYIDTTSKQAGSKCDGAKFSSADKDGLRNEGMHRDENVQELDDKSRKAHILLSLVSLQEKQDYGRRHIIYAIDLGRFAVLGDCYHTVDARRPKAKSYY